MTPLRRFASSPWGTTPVARQSRFYGVCWMIHPLRSESLLFA